MTTKEAIEVLTSANEWRRYDGELKKKPEMPDPKQFGLAIDHAVEIMKRFEGAVEVDIDFDNRIIWAKNINADVEEALGYPQKVQYYAIPKEQDD